MPARPEIDRRLSRSLAIAVIVAAVGATGYFILGSGHKAIAPVPSASPKQQPSPSAPPPVSGKSAIAPLRMRGPSVASAEADSNLQANEGREREDGRMRRGDRNQLRADMVAQFDADGDGELSDEERALLRASRMERRAARDLEFFDDDGDGFLDADELATKELATSDMVAERASHMLSDSDADTDGRLSRSEAESGDRRMQRLLRDFDDVDEDGDGFISAEELQSAVASRRGGRDAGLRGVRR